MIKPKRLKKGDTIGSLGIPAIWGLPIGHTHDLATIPIGVDATLDATKGDFIILETATEYYS